MKRQTTLEKLLEVSASGRHAQSGNVLEVPASERHADESKSGGTWEVNGLVAGGDVGGRAEGGKAKNCFD